MLHSTLAANPSSRRSFTPSPWNSAELLVDSILDGLRESIQQRILIVEDEENARKGYEALLRKWDYEVLGVGTGEDALAKFPEFSPDVILADVELPGMNGLELLRPPRRGNPERFR